jgi:phage repressor protein C with HTH and peptisase S24 domain
VTLGVRRVDAPAPQRAAPFAGSPLAMTDAAARVHCTPLLELSAAAGEGRELWDAECESWIDLPRDVPPGRCVALTVSGDSMVPLMHAGDVILVMLGPRIASDSVIVARRPDEGYVVKRVGRIRRETVELLSLNDTYPPIAIPRDARLVVGTVVLRWCTH